MPAIAAVLALVLAPLAVAPPALAETASDGPLRIGVRAGDHPAHGRIVFYAPPGLPYRVERLGEGRLALRFDAPAGVVLDLSAARPPRNIAGIRAAADGAEILLRPGAQPRHFRLGGLVVLDAHDPKPPGRRPGVPATQAAPAGAPATEAAAPPRSTPRPAAEGEGREPARPAGPGGTAERREHQAIAPAGAAEASARASRATGATPGSGSPEPPPGSPVAEAAPALASAAPPPMAEALSPAPPSRTSGGDADAAAAPSPGAQAEARPQAPATASAARVAEALSPPEAAAPAAPSPATAMPLEAAAVPDLGAPPATSPGGRPQGASGREAPEHAVRRVDRPAPPQLRSPPANAQGDARPVRLVADGEPPGRAVLLPFGPGVGAAAFRRGDAALVVFDTAQALDLGALAGDPLFGGTEAWTTEDATVLRLPLAAPGRLVPRPSPEHGNAWLVEMRQEAEPPARALAPEADTGPSRLVIPAIRPGRSVVLADPESGAPLLVGTLREGGQAMHLARRGAQFELLPSVLGAVVLARSDALVLRAGVDRFILFAAGGAELELGDTWDASPPSPPSAAEEAQAMRRVLDLPSAPAAALSERLRTLQGAIAATAPLARAPLRREAAEALLALGLAQEAQAMAALAFREDPRVRDDPRLLLAHGAAALLAGRPAEAARAIEDRRLPETEETLLWRGALAAARGAAAEAAPALAATAPLLLTYPEAMQAKLLPPVAEALIEAGGREALAAARRLLDEAPAETPRLALARARLAEAEGRAGEALAAYDVLARGHDRLARARAIHRAVELRLASGALDPAGAAAALEAALFAWRGDAIEVGARLRLAALKRQTGDAEGAFALLRETEAQHPAHAASLRPELREALLAAMAQAPPLTAVTLADANRDLLPETGEAGLAAVMLLADRLVALDLSDRAVGLLRAAAARGAAPPVRAALGARLAALRLGEGDAAGALAALASTAAPDLPQALATEREVLRARALARSGDREAAVAALRRLGAAGAAALAEVLAEAQDWPGAAAALSAHLEGALPAPPAPLAPEHQRALARLAAFAALAGDEGRLAALRAAHGGRMRGGPLGEAFELLTAGPVRGLEDLPRLHRELEAIRTLTSRLEPLRASRAVTR